MNRKTAFPILLLFVALLWLPAKAEKLPAAPSLKTALGSLTAEPDGIRLTLDKACPSSIPQGDYTWAMTLENQVTLERVVVKSTGLVYRMQPIRGGFRLVYNQLPYKIGLELDFEADAQGFVLTGRVSNRQEGWYVVAFAGPVIGGLNTTLEQHRLYMPTGLGQQFTQSPSAENPIDKTPLKGALTWKSAREGTRYDLKSHYPSRFATMQWCTLSGAHGGLYFGSHDAQCRSKHFNVRYKPESRTLGFHFTHEMVCFEGQTTELPPLIIRPYKGSWHRAADFYRAWYNDQMPVRKVPQWAQDASGWLLTILKQQNDEIMWDYASVGNELADIAAARGLDVIGLFGWTEGGHDRWYPYYRPDKAMGGREELVKSLAKLRARGMRSIIYANGQLIDQHGTDYWDKTGKQITVVNKDGKLDYQKWHKYYDAPARFHGMACLGCTAWEQQMISLAEQANELGADGILYDQLAVTAPKYCYSSDHGHSTPAVVYETERYALLKRIDEHMRKINPDFVVMTEGICDAELNSISYFHGYMNGAYVPLQNELDARLDGTAPTSVFPEMFNYTHPEVLYTFRNPSPVNNRLILNYSTAYGMRHELEARYAADRRYLEQDRTPTPEDYRNVVSKPDLRLVTSQDPQAMLRYTRQVVDFQRKHKELLWDGRFVDSEGFGLSGDPGVVAKAFTAGDRMGVVVWNVSDQKSASFRIDAQKARLIGVDSPEGTVKEAFGPLAPQSVRLLIYKK